MITAERIVKAFESMITDMQHRHDDLKGTLDKECQSDYSEELTETIAVMSILKNEGQTIVMGERHHHINCRQFGCESNVSGDCAVESHTFEPKGNLVISDLICVEAEEKEKKDWPCPLNQLNPKLI